MGPLHVVLGPEWVRYCIVYTEWLIHLSQLCVSVCVCVFKRRLSSSCDIVDTFDFVCADETTF